MEHEFESVLCAALLHDIGKFTQRSSAEIANHWKFSEGFITKHASRFSNPELIKTLVGHHHESKQYTAHSDRPDAIIDERTRVLAYLVSRADNLASGERAEAPNSVYKPLSALDSVFTQIDIGESIPQANWRYPISVLYKGSVRPVESLDLHSGQNYEQHCLAFERDFEFAITAPYVNMVDTLLSLLQKYLWCIPSDTTKELRDISLADHSKVTCALAACYYKYHDQNGWSEAAVQTDSTVRTRLVCGDVSGIQDYIYGIASIGQGGVAKRLRGRSFNIALLTEAVALLILRDLDLPMACKVMSAGGQFYLLIPNTESAETTLQATVNRVTQWLLDEYAGELAVITADVELSALDLKQSRFDERLRALNGRIVEAKQRKYDHIINAGPVTFELNFQGSGACAVCERFPATGPTANPQPCKHCSRDERLGRVLAIPGDIYLVLIKASTAELEISSDECKLSLFGAAWTAVVTTEPTKYRDLIMVYNLRSSQLVANKPCGFALHAGYVPRWKSASEYNAVPLSVRKDDDYSDVYLNSGRAVKSFTTLAHTASGNKLLGVLRADVDHLGLVFSLGMKNRASLSRIATLSSMLTGFFTYELTTLIETEFPNVYTAYSGGDDLMLLGPWDDTIRLSKRIRDELTSYTAKNPNITISAGIGTFRPQVPIATTSVMTGDILDRSKDAGRDSLTLFDTSFKWFQYDEFMQWAQDLSESLSQAGNGISTAFLYRLFSYQQQASAYTHGEASSVMYKPHLAYDIARNFRKHDGNSTIDDCLLEKLTGLINADLATWRLLKAAITYSAYLHRRVD